MANEDVQWLTTEELISELMSRETFMGIVVRPSDEVRDDEPHESFTMSIKGMHPEDARLLLSNAMESL